MQGFWRDSRWYVFAVVATVAVFSFIVSYSHIFDLGRAHAQAGTAARLLPLSVDLLIVGASLVLFTLERPALKRSPGFWMPRLVLYAAIAATVAANVAYGLPYGWLSAVISGWPGIAFVAAVEVGILVADPVKRGRAPAARAQLLPAEFTDKMSAAEVAYRRSVQGGNPFKPYALATRFDIPRPAAAGIVERVDGELPAGGSPTLLAPAGPNGNGPHG